MTDQLTSDLGFFLAHSLELESESAERLREVAHVMHAHRQEPLAALFEELAVHSDQHAAEVRAICDEHDLPELTAWEYDWPANEPPETAAYDTVSYESSPREALQAMITLETNARDFYQSVADMTQDETIRKYAALFATEEAEHARLLEARLIALPKAASRARVDTDPPLEIE